MSLASPDKKRCQAEKPTKGPFALGGPVGDPKNGYRVRCSNVPTFIATEKVPGKDGQVGSMSLCEDCKSVMVKQLGPNFAIFERVES